MHYSVIKLTSKLKEIIDLLERIIIKYKIAGCIKQNWIIKNESFQRINERRVNMIVVKPKRQIDLVKKAGPKNRVLRQR